MMTRTTEELDRVRRVAADRPRPATRTAGLYNEVTWDRSWTTPPRPASPAAAGRDGLISPAE